MKKENIGKKRRIETIDIALAASFFGSALLFCVGTVFRGDGLELSLMCKSDYGNLLWFLYNSVFGSLTVLTLSMILARLSRESAYPFRNLPYVAELRR